MCVISTALRIATTQGRIASFRRPLTWAAKTHNKRNFPIKKKQIKKNEVSNPRLAQILTIDHKYIFWGFGVFHMPLEYNPVRVFFFACCALPCHILNLISGCHPSLPIPNLYCFSGCHLTRTLPNYVRRLWISQEMIIFLKITRFSKALAGVLHK